MVESRQKHRKRVRGNDMQEMVQGGLDPRAPCPHGFPNQPGELQWHPEDLFL